MKLEQIRRDIKCPTVDIGSLDDILTLFSLIASFAGFKTAKVENSSVNFNLYADIQNEYVFYECTLPKPFNEISIKYIGVNDSKGQHLSVKSIKSIIDRLVNLQLPRIQAFCRRLCAMKESAKAAIMARNFSHNVGSHVLANPNLYHSIVLSKEKKLNKKELSQPETADDVGKHRLATFHGYMQGRLDFLARAVSENRDTPEPLFFLGDVMQGFFKQGVLLDTLVEDMKFSAKKIQFLIEIGGKDVIYTYQIIESQDKQIIDKYFQPVKNSLSQVKDEIVGIPGGIIGVQALYAFLENVLRNAVKYGAGIQQLGEGPLIISLRLSKCKGRRVDNESGNEAWILTVEDNVSSNVEKNGKTVVQQIREFINLKLVNDEGDIEHKGHGIQEMKLCAEQLAGGLRFSADDGYKLKSGHAHIVCSECEKEKGKNCRPTKHYAKTVKKIKKKDGHFIKSPQPLRCYVREDQRDNQIKERITYDLLMPIPVLLGVVRLGTEGRITKKLPPYIKYYDSSAKLEDNLKELAEKGAHIAVLLDNDNADIGETLDKVAELHPYLPFRLMVVTTTKRKSKWNPDERHSEKNEAFVFGTHIPTHIPTHRLQVCGDEGLHALLSNRCESGPTYNFVGSTGWDAVMLHAYDAWMRVYKPKEKGWQLRIGFDRDEEAVAEQWKDNVSKFDGSSYISILVKGTGSESSNSNPVKSKNWKESNRVDKEQCIVFDNHGKVFPDSNLLDGDGNIRKTLSECPAFYQKLGLKEGLSLFQNLKNTPRSAMGFAFFIYSLVEGALTRVAVLDERLAESMEHDGTLFSPIAHQYHAAGIFPILSVKKNGKKPSSISENISSLLEKSRNKQYKFCDAFGSSKPDLDEGLIIGSNEIKVIAKWDEIEGRPLDPIDVLLIHEGVMDHLYTNGLWEDSDTFKLYQFAPTVVRCSGRGRKSRHLHNAIPFLEFTEVSGNTYQELNKPNLVKAMLGSSGNIKGVNEKGVGSVS